MIALQKNQDNIVGGSNNNKSSRRASANLSNINENPNAQETCDNQQIKLNNIRPTNSNQRLSQQQMMVMNKLGVNFSDDEHFPIMPSEAIL